VRQQRDKNKLDLKKIILATILTFSLNSLQSPAWAAGGDLDTSFSGDGKQTTAIGSGTDQANSVVLQSDGKIVAAGYSRNGVDEDFAVVRYNTDGSLDTTFSGDGIVTTAIGIEADVAWSVVLQSDGKIVAAGYSFNGTNNDFAVVRYNTDGSLDTTFSGDGIVTTAVGLGPDVAYSVVLQSDGKIVAAGYSSNGTNNDFAVVRYTSTGLVDTTFDTDGKVTTAVGLGFDGAYSVVLQSDGKIVAAGYSSDGSNNDFAVVRYTSTGLEDITFGGGDGIVTTAIGLGADVAWSVVLQSDGKIVAAGYSNNGSGTDNDFAVVRYNSDGSLDTSFGTGGKAKTAIGLGADVAWSAVLQSDGKIVAAGYSYNGTNNDVAVVRYNTDGSLDTTFDADGKQTTAVGAGEDEAYSVVLQSDGKIVVAGYSYNGTDDDFAVVRYTISVSALSWVGEQSINCPAPNPWVNEKLGFASNAKPVLVSAENTIGKTITQSSYDALQSSGVVFDTVSTKVSTATETLPIYGCKDKLLSGKVNQPIQFIAGGYTLQSVAHGYINTADLKWHDTNGVTLYTNTAAFMHTIKFTKTGKYVVVLTEQPDTSRGLIPTYGVRSIRFVININ
jgi:uncharacterized delta-60 repeat protein